METSRMVCVFFIDVIFLSVLQYWYTRKEQMRKLTYKFQRGVHRRKDWIIMHKWGRIPALFIGRGIVMKSCFGKVPWKFLRKYFWTNFGGKNLTRFFWRNSLKKFFHLSLRNVTLTFLTFFLQRFCQKI